MTTNINAEAQAKAQLAQNIEEASARFDELDTTILEMTAEYMALAKYMRENLDECDPDYLTAKKAMLISSFENHCALSLFATLLNGISKED